MSYKVSTDLPLLSIKEPEDLLKEGLLNVASLSSACPAKSKEQQNSLVFDAIEKAGTECTYRCIDCRKCSKCKKNKDVEHVTIREEVEQDMIEKSVDVDIVVNNSSAGLPFMGDPTLKLPPSNHTSTSKIYHSVVKGLNSNPSNKGDVIETEQKLQDAGFVDYFDNLTDEQKEKISNSKVHYYIPWRPVWNLNSVSTKCRIVFDASYSPRGENSLMIILPSPF